MAELGFGSPLVYLHLDEELRRLGHTVTLLTDEDYLPSQVR
jgi:hypothetical protein